MEKYGVSYQQIYSWMRKYEEKGVDGLNDRRGKAKPEGKLNGPMEGWWGMLKSEMYYLRRFTSKEELISAIVEYIDYYNTKRYQLKLNCMTPMEYHEAYAA